MSEDGRLRELRRFLKERRARVRPEDVGLPAGRRRRVAGLRREEVASLAGIGVSWYTALENGEAENVSRATLQAVATALRLSESERHYLEALAGHDRLANPPVTAEPLALATLEAIVFPAYAIETTWNVVACNAAFRRVWALGPDETRFNAFERMFLHPAARALHGAHFAANAAPVLAMLRSSLGRHPQEAVLVALRDRLVTDADLSELWDRYEIASPLLSNAVTIESPLGTFRYETLTLPVSPGLGIIVQVPDPASRARL